MRFHQLGASGYVPRRIRGLLAATLLLLGGTATVAGQPAGEPPRAIHVVMPEIRFGPASLQTNYERLCGTDLAGIATFGRSAYAAEQELDKLGSKPVRRSRLKDARAAVRLAASDHQDLRDRLFKCLIFLQRVADNGDSVDAATAEKAIKLHQGTMTTVDGGVIKLLIGLDRLTL